MSEPDAPRFGVDAFADSLRDPAAQDFGRIAYVGNAASRTIDGRLGLTALQDAGADVVALWVPEHGFDVTLAPGAHVPDGASDQDLPAFSLYGRRMTPDARMLGTVDTIVYDLQDVGARYFTYWYVLKRCLEGACRAGKRMVVCERPNPLGRAQWGNVLAEEADAPVGCWPMAMQHGLTSRDVALYADPSARVVPYAGPDDAAWDAFGLPWLGPSPNLPTLDAVRAYPGTCLGEGMNVSVGRGTPWPFQWLGAPWLDGQTVADAVESAACGWRAAVESCTPAQDPYAGERCTGVLLRPSSNDSDPVRGALTLIDAILRRHADAIRFHAAHFDALAGGPALREGLQAGTSVPTLMDGWAAARARAPLRPARRN